MAKLTKLVLDNVTACKNVRSELEMREAVQKFNNAYNNYQGISGQGYPPMREQRSDYAFRRLMDYLWFDD